MVIVMMILMMVMIVIMVIVIVDIHQLLRFPIIDVKNFIDKGNAAMRMSGF